jgi:hypothetical protein
MVVIIMMLTLIVVLVRLSRAIALTLDHTEGDLMTKQFKDLMASAAVRRFSTEQDLDRWLDEHRITDPELRIAVKLQLQAAGRWQPEGRRMSAVGLATDQVRDAGLATDRARYAPPTPPVTPAMATWLRKAGLSLDLSYTDDQVTQALTRAGLDTLARMSVKAELYDRGLIRAASAAPRGTLQAARDMRAQAERPRPILRHPDGTPRTLTFG